MAVPVEFYVIKEAVDASVYQVALFTVDRFLYLFQVQFNRLFLEVGCDFFFILML